MKITLWVHVDPAIARPVGSPQYAARNVDWPQAPRQGDLLDVLEDSYTIPVAYVHWDDNGEATVFAYDSPDVVAALLTDGAEQGWE